MPTTESRRSNSSACDNQRSASEIFPKQVATQSRLVSASKNQGHGIFSYAVGLSPYAPDFFLC